MTLLQSTCAAIVPVDQEIARQVQDRLDHKTKPRRSLGRLEELACRLAAIQGTIHPLLPAKKAVVVLAGDHGVAEEGVSAYPQEVTAQMVRNFLKGGAAINVLARQQGAEILVADMGTKIPVTGPGIHSHRLGPGTTNFTRGPAMSRGQAILGLEIGIQLAKELHDKGVDLLAVGEMGIANTTAASAITAVLAGRSPEQVTGRGTGIDEELLHRKIAVIEKALAFHQPDPADPLDVLARLGGFEIAGLVGLLLGGAARRLPVLLDGFITGAAALVAAGLCPAARDYWIASHRSVEPGHEVILKHLNIRPLFDLEMRLGEGTGAVLAMPLVEASLRLLGEMATFNAAGVTDSGA